MDKQLRQTLITLANDAPARPIQGVEARVPFSVVAAHLDQAIIRQVKVLSPDHAQVTTDAGTVIGRKEDVLPPELLRLLASAFRTSKMIGLRFFRDTERREDNDKTYDEDSTVGSEDKPKEPADGLHPKERGIRREFHRAETEKTYDEDSEDEDQGDKPPPQRALHPKELAVLRTFDETLPHVASWTSNIGSFLDQVPAEQWKSHTGWLRWIKGPQAKQLIQQVLGSDSGPVIAYFSKLGLSGWQNLARVYA